MNLHLKNENKIHRNLNTEVENYFELPLNFSVETFKGDFQAELPCNLNHVVAWVTHPACISAACLRLARTWCPRRQSTCVIEFSCGNIHHYNKMFNAIL